MNIQEIFLLSFDALKDRKVRSILTILMVVVGSSLMVALNGLSAGFGKFIDESFSLLAPNILFVSSAQQDESASGPFGGGGDPHTLSSFCKRYHLILSRSSTARIIG